MDRVFYPAYLTGDLPQTAGTVMGWDETLEADIRGRAHRKHLMEQRGLAEYVPDPLHEKCREEVRHIRKHAPGPEGRAAVQKVREQSARERRKQAVRSAWEGAVKDKGWLP